LAKRLSVEKKKEILNFFIDSKLSIEELSKKFECTNATIIRNLKKELGNAKYQAIIAKGNSKKNLNNPNEDIKIVENQNIASSLDNNEKIFDFVELPPLDYKIDNVPRKEISSVSINDIELPNVVYLIINKSTELEIKLLKDYPEWEFLPKEDLKRKTIEIYFDLKLAKKACTKDQKVIKIPNTDVFRIVSPILISRGISRIVSSDNLIAL